MNPPSVEIQAVTPQSIDAASHALADAFENDPFFRHLVGDDQQRRRWLPYAMRANLRLTLPDAQTYSLIDPNGRTLGALASLPPGRYPVPLLRNLRFLWEFSSKPRLLDPRLRDLLRGIPYMRALDRMHFKPPHWYVFVIGVRNSEQGKGFGRLLLSPILDRARSTGHPVYLETQTESNLTYYQSFGFEIIETAHPSRDGPPSWGMLKRP